MDIFERWFEQDLTKKVGIQHAESLAFSGNNESNVVGVYVYKDGVPAELAGTVSGTVIRPDGMTVPLTGTLDGNAVSAVLTEACFAAPGYIGVALTVTSGDITMTVLKATFEVEPIETGTVVDPSGEITANVAELISDIEAAVATIPPSYSDLLAAIAPTFDPEAATPYLAGSYVWYSGKLYRFAAAHTGAWTGTDAVSVSVGGEISDFHTSLNGLRTFPTLTWDIGKNIGSTGSLQNNQYTALTKPIPVDSGDVIVRTTPQKDSAGKSLLVYINTFALDVWSERVQLEYNGTYTIPDGVTTIRIGYGRTSATGVVMTQEDVDTYFSMDFFSFSTVLKQRFPIIGTSFADNAKLGVYNFGGGSPYSDMTDAPSATFGGGCMIVIPAGSNTYNRLQIIYDLSNRIIYRRYLSYNNSTARYDVGEWVSANIAEWSAFDFAATYTQIRTLDASATRLSANTDIGLYRVGSFGQEPMATYIANGDYPDAKFGGGWMAVLPAGGNNGVCQIVYDIVNGYANSRYISGNTLQNVGAWNATRGIKWAAIGDSITYGVYSSGASSSAVDRNKCYAKRVANLIGAEVFNNLGVRGLGYINSGNNGETLKNDVIDNQAIDWTDYNLITVALGVNDYYGNRAIGTQSDAAWSGTVYGSIRGTIESLMTYNPAAKLIFITPFNMKKSGDASTHWGKGYAKSNIGTLSDVKDAIIYWCDYYGIEYINETDYSVINDLNIGTLLPDSLHPSADAHALLAKEIAAKINFK